MEWCMPNTSTPQGRLEFIGGVLPMDFEDSLGNVGGCSTRFTGGDVHLNPGGHHEYEVEGKAQFINMTNRNNKSKRLRFRQIHLGIEKLRAGVVEVGRR